MATHKVTIDTPPLVVGHMDIVVKVTQNGGKFGLLKISKGGVEWLPSGKVRPFRLSWKRLNEAARTGGKRKRTKRGGKSTAEKAPGTGAGLLAGPTGH